MPTHQEIHEMIQSYENPERIALSMRYPWLEKPIVTTRQVVRGLQNAVDLRIQRRYCSEYYPSVVARHRSVLRRKLGNTDMKLQERKVKNLQLAVQQLDGLVIQPGGVFSFWEIIGRPSYQRGFVDGMLIARGKVLEGLGGGLCQLSNFMYWILLHAPTQVLERHHHAMDVFPDSGRVLPFGSGATVFYNYIDLKMKNISKQPLQLKIWLTENHLKGQVLSPLPFRQKYHIREEDHCFYKCGSSYYRYNVLYRETRVEGDVVRTEKLTTNCAPVVYDVDDDSLRKIGFTVIHSQY
jgi:vancomycin resistance protein VanW